MMSQRSTARAPIADGGQEVKQRRVWGLKKVPCFVSFTAAQIFLTEKGGITEYTKMRNVKSSQISAVKKWILNLHLRSGGAESNAHICNHFVRGTLARHLFFLWLFVALGCCKMLIYLVAIIKTPVIKYGPHLDFLGYTRVVKCCNPLTKKKEKRYAFKLLLAFICCLVY